MDWQQAATESASSAWRATYADAIAEGLDESEARALADDVAEDTYLDASFDHPGAQYTYEDE